MRTQVKRVLKGVKLVYVNLTVFIILFLVLEVLTRSYAHVFMDGKHFFREDTFTSPWISTAAEPPLT